MDQNDYEKAREQLYDKWKAARPEYESDSKFVYDGIVYKTSEEWEKWQKQIPKILVLLKDARDDYEPNEPTPTEKKFQLNLARWRYAIEQIFKTNIKPSFPTRDILPGNNVGMAIVEVKKTDENRSSITQKVIKEYAEKDKIFLREQIDLINPDVILCGNTFDNGYDPIYSYTYAIEEKLFEFEKCSCWKLNNRLVIDFYHPSYFAVSPEDLYDVLCKMLIEGNVFNTFKWARDYRNSASA